MSNQPFISNDKYETTGETKIFSGRILHQIRAKKDFGGIKAGDLGGWIEKESNLSPEGNCWVFDNAHVYNNARVYGNAQVSGNACIYGNACIWDNAYVSGNVHVFGNACIYGNAQVYGNVHVFGNACIYGNADIWGNAEISSSDQYMSISPIGSENGTLTAFKNKDGVILVNRGCFYGTIDEFEDAAMETHGNNKFGTEYLMICKVIKLRLSDV